MQLISPSTPQARSAASEESAVTGRRPMVERIACWSARHRVLALCAWLFMVGSALLAGQLAGTSNLPEYDPGQSGVAEQMLTRLHVVTPPSESVLIQSKGPGPERTFAAYPPMRLAARQVVTALRDLPATAANIQSPFGRDGKELIEPGGGGVLITFRVAGPNDDADNTVREGAACGRGGAGQASVADHRRGGRRERGPGRHRHARPGLPLRRTDLGAADAAVAADRVRRADRGQHPGDPRRDGGDDGRVAAGGSEPLAADRAGHLRGRPDHRDGGRHRLHAVLPAPRTGGTGRRGELPRRACGPRPRPRAGRS